LIEHGVVRVETGSPIKKAIAVFQKKMMRSWDTVEVESGVGEGWRGSTYFLKGDPIGHGRTEDTDDSVIWSEHLPKKKSHSLMRWERLWEEMFGGGCVLGRLGNHLGTC
jgi:hypothetical protein